MKKIQYEKFTEDKLKYYRNSCSFQLNKNLKEFLDKNNIYKTDNQDAADILLPCGYNQIENEIKKFNLTNNKSKIFVLHNADNIVSKHKLWKHLVEYYGNNASNYVPTSYILADFIDLDKLKKEHIDGKLYILKKNIQRQEGLKIVNNISDIINNKLEYVIAQELLQDPYLIDGRKTNMRFYVLVVCNKSNFNVYLYNDGFMYYTKVPFKKNTTDFDTNVTTGYIDRQVYEVNPLTHQDMRVYLDKERPLTDYEKKEIKNGKLSQIYFSKINDLIRNVFIAFKNKIGNNSLTGSKLYNNISFQLFGVDVGVSDTYVPKIMEVNKGPDMGSKDEKDGQVKKGCIKHMMEIIGLIPISMDNKFTKII
jgi:hypothetical protein